MTGSGRWIKRPLRKYNCLQLSNPSPSRKLRKDPIAKNVKTCAAQNVENVDGRARLSFLLPPTLHICNTPNRFSHHARLRVVSNFGVSDNTHTRARQISRSPRVASSSKSRSPSPKSKLETATRVRRPAVARTCLSAVNSKPVNWIHSTVIFD